MGYWHDQDMSAARPRTAPVDPDDLRSALADGRMVRVRLAPSAQFPDGVLGRVRRVGDPALDGAEFVFVEVTLDGRRDVLPFAPGDLSDPAAPPPRVPRRRPPAATAPEGRTALSAVTGGRRTRPATGTSTSPAVGPAATGGAPQRVVAGQSATSVPEPAAAPRRRGAQARAEAAAVLAMSPSPAAAARRGARSPLEIVLSTSGDESGAWSVRATVGARTVVRSTAVLPLRVWEIVQSLGNEALTRTVQTHLEDHRRSTERRAEALAAELAGVRAELASLPKELPGPSAG